MFLDRGIFEAFKKGILPPPDRTLAEWAEAEYYLPPESAAEPGLISLERTPYAYGICEAFDDPEVEEITMQMAAQLAKSTIILAAMGQVCATPGKGAPMLILMPTLDNAEMLSKERFAPMIKSSSALRDNLIDNRKQGAGQTILQKNFKNGAIVTFVGSNAPAALASRPVKYLLADEIDRFAISAGKEGDPLKLGIKRTSTFKGNGRKVLKTSTPTLKGISVVEREYKNSDMRVYRSKCPHCGDHHTLDMSYIHYEDDDWETARYVPPCCEHEWSEADRLQAISNGHWEATAPHVKGHAGFKMNALHSPWVGQWTNAIKEYLEAVGDPMLMQVFVNTFLGETYQSADLAIDEETLIGRMTDIGLDLLPEEVVLITAGADVQKDRVEVTLMGHAASGQIYILDHRKMYGDPSGPKLWAELDEWLQVEHQHPLGNTLGVDSVAIDSGYLAQTVYDFVKEYADQRYHAIKGVSGDGKLIWTKSANKTKSFDRLWLVGVDSGKEVVMERLKIGDRDSPSFVHFAHMGTETDDMSYAEQVLSEYRDVEILHGRPVYKWKRKKGKAAEALDCWVYAYAAFTSLSPNWEMRTEALKRKEQTQDDGWAIMPS